MAWRRERTGICVPSSSLGSTAAFRPDQSFNLLQTLLLFLHPLPPSGLPRLPYYCLWYNNHHCCTFSHLLTSHCLLKNILLSPGKQLLRGAVTKGHVRNCQKIWGQHTHTLEHPNPDVCPWRFLKCNFLLQKTRWLLHNHIKSSASSLWSILFFWQCCTIQSQISVCCSPGSMELPCKLASRQPCLLSNRSEEILTERLHINVNYWIIPLLTPS